MKDDPVLTPELEAKIAQAIMENKPYLLALEERVQSINYGTLEVRINIRAGVVEKMDFFEGRTWLKSKTT